MPVLINSTNLKDLELIQKECAKKVILSDITSQVELFAGIDVTYEDPLSSPTRSHFSSIGPKFTLEKAKDFLLMISIYRIPETLRFAHNLLKKFKMRNKGGVGNHACLQGL
ncbi:MAG: hypothetical protein N2Z40_06185 [Caldimicrobium sp.]|nr:hypothetical protein [Caldimicrobium sp.]MCX7613790.1 hypothetical protein [Caldimicrobium sp.]MDW8182617.1 hypothetical protein [Caldimicrobium sp.]